MNMTLDMTREPSGSVVPQAPQTVRDTGLSGGFLLDLLVKTLARRGMERVSDMAKALCLPVGVTDRIVEQAKEKELLMILGQRGAKMTEEMRYQLTDQGRAWAERAFAQNGWSGPAPVPIEQFCAQLNKQSIRGEKLTESALGVVFKELVLPAELMHKIGPAVNSGASILLYGPPGNGKSSIATAVCRAFGNMVFLPHAIAIGSDVAVFYDPAVHRPLQIDEHSDPGALRRPKTRDMRYVPCERPAVIMGGELTVDKFDMVLNPVTKLYDAPLQLKAAGGLFVVDDFGRQRETPQELINRLIIPLESGSDHLVLQNGRKVEVPFDTLVIFATNFEPRSLMDEAGLRRLRHKILVDRPDRKTFMTILVRTAERAGLPLDEEALAHLMFELYAKTPSARYNAFHPRFLVDQCRSICAYQGIQAQMTPEVLDQAWENLVAAH
ncbi:MAG: AAA family ATPase [Pseudomonadota bacterium]